jgi:hypothetical protein
LTGLNKRFYTLVRTAIRVQIDSEMHGQSLGLVPSSLFRRRAILCLTQDSRSEELRIDNETARIGPPTAVFSGFLEASPLHFPEVKGRDLVLGVRRVVVAPGTTWRDDMSSYVRVLAVWCAALIILTACGNEAPTAGEATPFEAVCAGDNEGRRVAVDGYLIFPDSFTEAQSVVLRLHQSDAFDGTPIGVQMPFGTAPNQVEQVADQFSDDDLQVHLADGTMAGFGTKVTVSGKVYVPLAEQTFPCALENPLVELAE